MIVSLFLSAQSYQ